jgi:2-polyprenyl-6-hydroxyphenyl methylase/3-demethylubiquinone-9 3-methyltransferase
MTLPGKGYSATHWLRSEDSQKALAAYLEQQNKAYSRVKNRYVAELLGDLSGKRFLDYGCGGGMFTVHAAKHGALAVVGVDALDTALGTAALFARQEGVDHLCTFLRSEEFPELKLGPKFDVILLKDVIEHVQDDQALLTAVEGSLVPGGLVVLSTQNSLSLNYLIQGSYRRHVRGEKDWFGWDETHLRFYTPTSLKRKLRTAGLYAERWRSVYLVPYKLPRPRGSERQFWRLDPLSLVDRALGWIFPYNRLGWNLIVAASSSRAVPRRVRFCSPLPVEVPGAPVIMGRDSIDPLEAVPPLLPSPGPCGEPVLPLE